MPYPLIKEYRSVLSLRPGSRPFGKAPELDEANFGRLVPSPNPRVLHWGNGSFAVVYKFQERSGNYIALRCPLSPPATDVAERCKAIDAFRDSQGLALPFLVRESYFDDGLLIRGSWFPIFVMDWVDGKTLTAQLEVHTKAGNQVAIQRLADNWRTLVEEMQSAHFAHGDLQHGNVMVVDSGSLRLVDYDTVFVPSLSGKSAVAIGTEGYIHPSHLRTKSRPYHDRMDTFGALVIFLSLSVLAYMPSLYGKFTADNLLLSKSDLDDPKGSAAFSSLHGLPDPHIRHLTQILQDLCLASADTNETLVALLKGVPPPIALYSGAVATSSQQSLNRISPAHALGPTLGGSGQSRVPIGLVLTGVVLIALLVCSALGVSAGWFLADTRSATETSSPIVEVGSSPTTVFPKASEKPLSTEAPSPSRTALAPSPTLTVAPLPSHTPAAPQPTRTAHVFDVIVGSITGDSSSASQEWPVILPASSSVAVTLIQTNAPCLSDAVLHVTMGGVPSSQWTVETSQCRYRVVLQTESGGPAVIRVTNYGNGMVADYTLRSDGFGLIQR